MAYQLHPTYGKQSVPVFKIQKSGARHEIIDLKVQIMLEGDVADSWLEGENHQIVPTETQKNTCYVLALKTDYDCPEQYAIALARDMLRRHRHLTAVNIDISERIWQRIEVGGRPHAHAFSSSAKPICRTCSAHITRSAVRMSSGIRDINLMKTTQSGFKGFIQDEYTTLQPVGEGSASPDRIMSTQLTGSWTYGRLPAGNNFKEINAKIVETLIEKFAGPADTGVFSKSLQQTGYNMATTVLDRFPEIDEVHLATPNIHFYPWDVKPFGMSNPNVVFQATDCDTTASGRIVTHVTRRKAKL